MNGMTPTWIETYAAERADGQIALKEAWRLAVSVFAGLELDDSSRQTLLRACATPMQVQRLTRLLRPAPLAHAQHLFTQADESRHSLAAWILALETFLLWLDDRHRTSPLPTLLGYLNCTEDAVPDEPLASALRQMLAQYGFDG